MGKGMVVVLHFVAEIAGDDIQVMMSFRPHFARTEQGTFKLVSMATKLSIDLQKSILLTFYPERPSIDYVIMWTRHIIKIYTSLYYIWLNLYKLFC